MYHPAVPPYNPDNDYHGSSAAIEYAVSVLGVKHIIVCGHSHCGACKSLYQDLNDSPDLIHVKKWLELGKRAKEYTLLAIQDKKDKEKYLSFFKQCVDKNGVEFLFNNNDTTFENMVQYEESLLDYRYLPNVINYLDFKMIKIEKIDTIKFFITRLIDEPTLFDKRNEIKKEQDIFLEKIVLTEQQYLLKEMKNNTEIKKKARI